MLWEPEDVDLRLDFFFFFFLFSAPKATETVTPRVRFLGTRTRTSSSLEEELEAEEEEDSLLFLFSRRGSGDFLAGGAVLAGGDLGRLVEGPGLGVPGRTGEEEARGPSRSKMDRLELWLPEEFGPRFSVVPQALPAVGVARVVEGEGRRGLERDRAGERGARGRAGVAEDLGRGDDGRGRLEELLGAGELPEGALLR